jgi:hypothetical protein
MGNPEKEQRPYVERMDDWVFIKNGYSFWTHLVPFAIAALLLLILSVPPDNLLLKLAGLLQQPSWIWLPAGLLTAIATYVYIATIHVQIRQGYLWPDADLRRTIGTSMAYIVLCTLMAYAVLRSALTRETTLGDVWACFLLAVLSLTGIGWKGPGSWVESIGIKSPDYTDGRLAARKLTAILQRVRSQERGDKKDVEEFLEAATNLRASIETNFESEPKWARANLESVNATLHTLVEQVETLFPDNDVLAVENFPAACSCQQESLYREFITALRTLGRHWHEWQCPKF